MNSLNLLSARVIGSASSEAPRITRSRSYSEGNLNKDVTEIAPIKRSASQHVQRGAMSDWEDEKEDSTSREKASNRVEPLTNKGNEQTPLLDYRKPILKPTCKRSGLSKVIDEVMNGLSTSLHWALHVLISPMVYVFKRLYYERGRRASPYQARKYGHLAFSRDNKTSAAPTFGSPDLSRVSALSPRRLARKYGRVQAQYSSPLTSKPENESHEKGALPTRSADPNTRSHNSSSSDDMPQARRSIRIKLHNEDTTRRRKLKKESAANCVAAASEDCQPTLAIADIKSPLSPNSSLNVINYTHSEVPPRPLLRRMQPSYSAKYSQPSRDIQKTLVIDLDETLIHSLAKGGRMSSGHMVEVKLKTAVGYGGTTLGPQHPILYYVHKRPHCDDFLRRVCKWYNLVIFTASVQEYADPVIDWLEQERKFFSSRLYRQHCTFRNGAYIKDLSSIEPDLGRVMILDNSPLSYIFHTGQYTQSVCDEVGSDTAKTMPSLLRAGSMIQQITISCTLFRFWRLCST